MLGRFPPALTGRGEVEVGLNGIGADDAGRRLHRIAEQAGVFKQGLALASLWVEFGSKRRTGQDRNFRSE